MLEREEYVEQAYFYRALSERLRDTPMQDVIEHLREELLATSKLPMAVDFMLAELRHHGVCGPAMTQLKHYFAPFQAYLVQESEDDRGRFDMLSAMRVLRSEAEYRGQGATRQGLFFFQFESLCRNRLRYDAGLKAIAEDPFYDEPWRHWILTVRREVGLVDLADMVYVRSQHYLNQRRRRLGNPQAEPEAPLLFGEKEGKIALANRRKDPLHLFAALQRHLGYPQVPRLQPRDPSPELLPQILRRLERMEVRLKMMEEEQREGAIDLAKYYPPPGERQGDGAGRG